MAVRVHNHCLHNADTARGFLDGLKAVKDSDMSGDGHL